MKYENVPEGTLIIGRFSSTCNSCGRGAATEQSVHDTIYEYSSQSDDCAGCGVIFTHVATDYAGEKIAKAIQEMRPDLEYVRLFPEYQPK